MTNGGVTELRQIYEWVVAFDGGAIYKKNTETTRWELPVTTERGNVKRRRIWIWSVDDDNEEVLFPEDDSIENIGKIFFKPIYTQKFIILGQFWSLTFFNVLFKERG